MLWTVGSILVGALAGNHCHDAVALVFSVGILDGRLSVGGW